MADRKIRRERRILGIVIVLSLAGILYFGIQAVREGSRRSVKSTDNPYAYDISDYRSSGEEHILYKELPSILPGMELITALAVDQDDRIYVAGDGAVSVFSPSGENLAIHRLSGTTNEQSADETYSYVGCLAVDGSGDIYTGLSGRIVILDPKGSVRARWESPSENALFTSIALAEDYVFAADAGTKVIWRWDRSGENPQRIGDRNPDKDIPGLIIPSPYFDVAIDEEGFLWAANSGRHQLENYTVSGDLRAFWGEAAMGIEGFCGCCNPSHFSLLGDGSFVTSEKGIPRIKIMNRAGLLAAVVAGPDQFAEGTVGLDLAVDSTDRILVLDSIRKMVRVFVRDESKGKKT